MGFKDFAEREKVVVGSVEKSQRNAVSRLALVATEDASNKVINNIRALADVPLTVDVVEGSLGRQGYEKVDGKGVAEEGHVSSYKGNGLDQYLR